MDRAEASLRKKETEIFKYKNYARMRSLAMYTKYGIDLK